MSNTIISIAFALVMTLSWTLPQRAAPDSTIPYPNGYRKWVHIGTTLVGAQSPFFASNGGIHHIYANERALKGYETGTFPNGSIVVFDLLDTKELNGATIEGPRKRIDVMVKDEQRFANTGGWGFERFLGDTETDPALTAEQRASCFSCHEKRKAQDYVFSKFRK
jgi:Cytochrome P460